eukprot:9428751-Pyramimonas_sp.AAC.2
MSVSAHMECWFMHTFWWQFERTPAPTSVRNTVRGWAKAARAMPVRPTPAPSSKTTAPSNSEVACAAKSAASSAPLQTYGQRVKERL